MSEINLTEVNCQKILFCTDFSENALIAFPQAVRAASHRGAQICLLHVITEPNAQFWKGYIYEVGDMDSKAHNDIDRAINEQYRLFVPDGVEFRVEVKIGEVVRSILDYIVEYGADLVVIGRQGHGAITNWLLGNVAEKVVRKAECPVLVVPVKKSE